MKISPIALSCLALTAGLSLVSTANAIPIAETQTDGGSEVSDKGSDKANDKANDVWTDDGGSVAVVVPDGETLTYVINGEIVEVPGGESIVIPKGSKDVFFPVGTIVTVKRAAIGKPFTYTVVRPVTLGGVNRPEFKKHTTAFVPSHTPGVKPDQPGAVSTIESNFVNPTTIGGTPGTDKN